MIIKKYVANTIQEAERIAKDELGPLATTLSTRSVKQKGLRALFSPNKIELTAAIEQEDLNRYQESKLKGKKEEHTLNENLEGLKKVLAPSGDHVEIRNQSQMRAPVRSTAKQGVELNYSPMGKPAAKEPPRQESSEDEDEKALMALKQRLSGKIEVNESPSQGLVEAFKDEIRESVEPPAQSMVEDSPVVASTAEVRATEEDVERLRRLIREEVAKTGTPSPEKTMVGSERFLVSKGVDRKIAQEIEGALEQRFPGVDMGRHGPERTQRLNAMRLEIAKRIRTAGPILLTPGSPTLVALVGPTGVGKTTTLAKIAAQYSQELKKRVGLITLDIAKVGAREQILNLAKSLGLPCHVAKDGPQLKAKIAELYDCHLILIDTGGRNQYEWHEVDEMAAMLSTVDGIRIELVLSATTKDVDAYGIVRQFSTLGPESLIVTKTDETIALGLLVNLSSKFDVPVSYLTTGQKIPEDLKIADSGSIARSLLVQHNNAEFNTIRQMALAGVS